MTAVHMLNSPLQSPGTIERTAKAPAARVGLMGFVADGPSEASLNSCLSQLSIPGAAIKRGGIGRAIQYLSTQRSPETIIVDISGVEMPASQTLVLAELCEPGVTVIAIGDRNDVGLYRELRQAGVSEYIVKPVTAQLLGKALQSTTGSTEIGPINRKLGRVIAIAGARGGVGATTVAIHLAWHLANRQNRRVMLLDLDLQTGDCALALNLKPTPGLREALANPLRIDSTFLERTMTIHGDRLFVLSAEEPLCVDPEFNAEAVETLIDVLRTQFHYVLVDVPRVPGAAYRQALHTADLRVIVADQTLRSVRDTVRLREALGDGDGRHCDFLLVNRSGESGRRSMSLDDMAKVKLRPNFVIPFRPKLFAGPGVTERGAFNDVVAALAAEISGREPQQKRWWRFRI
jgi:pilus assembly protein CpaE